MILKASSKCNCNTQIHLTCKQGVRDLAVVAATMATIAYFGKNLINHKADRCKL